jgi:phage/plasmid primase-like uncharacterized protein
MTSLNQVADQMAAAGLPPLPAGHPIADGKYKRFGPQKKAWYILREMDLRSGKKVVTGAFGIFQGENRNTIPVRVDAEQMSDADRAEYARKQREYEAKEAAARVRDVDMAANRAKDQWNKSVDKDAHPYLQRKQVPSYGLRVLEGKQLVIPMWSEGGAGTRLMGLQKIDADGVKLYNKGMDKIGAAYPIGLTEPSPKLIAIGEGYATCAAVHLVSGSPVVAAFDAGNIIHVARALRAAYPAAHLLLLADDDYLLLPRFIERLREEFNVSCGDTIAIDGNDHAVLADDGETVTVTAWWRSDAQGVLYIEADMRKDRMHRHYTYKNAGVSSCYAAAAEVGNASVVMPVFDSRNGEKWTDFNDLQVEQSIDALASQINDAIDEARFSLEVSHLNHPDEVLSPAAQQPKYDLSVLDAPPAPSSASVADFSDIPFFDDSPAPLGEVAAQHDFFAEGEGDEQIQLQEKPKKVYGQAHWDAVHDTLENFVLIYGEDLVWDVRQRMLMKISSMRTIISNSDVMKFWGGDARKWVLKKNIVFDPKEAPSPAVSGATATVNLFSGWKMQPKKGECLQIQTLLLHLVDGNEEMALWIMRWLAYPLRNRGAKMETSIIMHGDEGSGKNFFFEKVIKAIYGEYGYVIGNAQLESQFNDWASMKLFMVADEVVTRSELKHMKGKLKYLVSGDSIIVNPKGLPEHSEANHMNFVFLSNELQPLALDKTDRRYLVVWTPPALSKEFYVGVAKEIAAGGIAAFYDYLLNDIDMGDFDEHTKPIYNEAKDALIEKSLTPPERFYRDWSRGFLPLPFITCGATQLYEAFKVWCEKSGESRYIAQTIFSPTIARYAGDALAKKVIKYEYGAVVKQRWVFLNGNKPEGTTLTDWVAGATALFEEDLKKYRSRAVVNVTD